MATTLNRKRKPRKLGRRCGRRSFAQKGQEKTQVIEVVWNNAMDAFRLYLRDGTDYKTAFSEDSARARRELMKAIRRRAANKDDAEL